jgi:hypothetical protein
MAQMSDRPEADDPMRDETGDAGLDTAAGARLREAYRETAAPDDASRARVLAAVQRRIGESAATDVRGGIVLSWRIAAIAAALIFAIGALLGRQLTQRRGQVAQVATVDTAPRPTTASGTGTLAGTTSRPVRFVLVARGASRVSLVGDFNGWNAASTPMQPYGHDGLWEVALPVRAGRHVYAFVVDGSRWMTDPAAPRTMADGFGEPNSVLLVEEHGAGT